MKIDVSDFNRLAVTLAQVGPRTFKAAAMVTEKSARDIERDAKAFAPVDTGNLRSSIGTDLTVDALTTQAMVQVDLASAILAAGTPMAAFADNAVRAALGVYGADGSPTIAAVSPWAAEKLKQDKLKKQGARAPRLTPQQGGQ